MRGDQYQICNNYFVSALCHDASSIQAQHLCDTQYLTAGLKMAQFSEEREIEHENITRNKKSRK